jgi:hypothetical protein
MNDLVLAGKYLFLSGSRTAEYEPAVQLYLHQHGRGGWRSLTGTFPNAAKRRTLDEFPENVRRELASLRMPESPADRQPKPRAAPESPRWQGMLALTGCTLVLLFTLAALVVGAPVVFRAIVSLFR